MLVFYVAIISGVLDFFPEFLGAIYRGLVFLASYIPLPTLYISQLSILIESLELHASVLLGLFALCILWDTYSEKIVGVPAQGSSSTLPTFARAFFALIEFFVRVTFLRNSSQKNVERFVSEQAQCALVAVDMLALATLLKSMQLLESWSTTAFVCATVLGVVASIAWSCGAIGKISYKKLLSKLELANLGDDQAREQGLILQNTKNWVLITLRLAEPFLIFYFAVKLLTFLIYDIQMNSLSFLFAAALLLVGIVCRHGLEKVVAASIAIPDEDEPIAEERTVAHVRSDVKKAAITLLKWGLGSLLAVFGFALFLFLEVLVGVRSAEVSSLAFESEISHLLV